MKIEVLDHGYVELIESWGVGKGGSAESRPYEERADVPVDDFEVGIIEAARQSTQGSFRGWEPAACDCDHQAREKKANEDAFATGSIGIFEKPPTVLHRKECASILQPGDAKLLGFLYNNNHATPFEFAGMILEIEAPIFVFREWQRHRTQSYNEASARYAPLSDKNYIPTAERLMMGSGGNRQAASTGAELTEENAKYFQNVLHGSYAVAEANYQMALKDGVSKELARCLLPVGRYSKMRASANLRNWLAFLTLRADSRAQWEIRQYAHAVADIVKKVFPRTYDLWINAQVPMFVVSTYDPKDLKPGPIIQIDSGMQTGRFATPVSNMTEVEKPVDSEGGEL